MTKILSWRHKYSWKRVKYLAYQGIIMEWPTKVKPRTRGGHRARFLSFNHLFRFLLTNILPDWKCIAKESPILFEKACSKVFGNRKKQVITYKTHFRSYFAKIGISLKICLMSRNVSIQPLKWNSDHSNYVFCCCGDKILKLYLFFLKLYVSGENMAASFQFCSINRVLTEFSR